MQHLQPVPERNTQILEMLVGQGDNSDINVVLGKPLSILGHTDLFERVRNLLHRDLPDGYIVIRLNLEQGDRGFIRYIPLWYAVNGQAIARSRPTKRDLPEIGNIRDVSRIGSGE